MLVKNNIVTTIIIYLLLIIHKVNCSDHLFRNKRYLIFPNTSKIQFIMGFGIPVSLQDMSVTIGTVFKCVYKVPINSTQVTHHTPIVTYGRENAIIDRWDIYKIITNTLESFGYTGRTCLLKSICDVAAIPFHDSGLEIIHELMHIFFTPSSTKEKIKDYSDNEYYAAEELGKNLIESCNYYFPDCKLDVLQMFTKIKDMY